MKEMLCQEESYGILQALMPHEYVVSVVFLSIVRKLGIAFKPMGKWLESLWVLLKIGLKIVKSNFDKFLHILALGLVTTDFICLTYLAVIPAESKTMNKSDVFPAIEMILIGAFLIVMIIGVVLIHKSRPYSSSNTGRLIALLGVGLILVPLAILVALYRALLFVGN